MESPRLQLDQSVANTPRLYDLRAMAIATTLSPVFAGAFLISCKFAALSRGHRLGRAKDVSSSLITRIPSYQPSRDEGPRDPRAES